MRPPRVQRRWCALVQLLFVLLPRWDVFEWHLCLSPLLCGHLQPPWRLFLYELLLRNVQQRILAVLCLHVNVMPGGHLCERPCFLPPLPRKYVQPRGLVLLQQLRSGHGYHCGVWRVLPAGHLA